MANASTTRIEEGGPYRRKSVVFEQVQNELPTSFFSILNGKKQGGNNGVRVAKIVEDESEGSLVYDPTYPDTNKEDYIEMPNVNVTDEMVNMISASRPYEANVNSFNSMKAMFTKALEIGK